MTDPTESLESSIARMLLRYFRNGRTVSAGAFSRFEMNDVAFLRIHWAMSSLLRELATQLETGRAFIRADEECFRLEGSGVVRGRIDSVRSLLLRLRTSDASSVVWSESRKNYNDGQVHVLAWVLRFSEQVLLRYSELVSGSEGYSIRINSLLRSLEIVFSRCGSFLRHFDCGRRPSQGALTQALRSRVVVYRMAGQAFQLLQRLDRGEPQATAEVLRDSLVGPLENWQKFELLLAFRMAEALAAVLKREIEFHPIAQGSSRPILTVGPFGFYWQNRTKYQSFDYEPEPSEKIVEDILSEYGVPAGSSRPDIVVCDAVKCVPVAIAEAKWTTLSANENDLFRDAASQLVRYSRMYSSVSQDDLLGRSIIAISNLGARFIERAITRKTPRVVNLEQLLHGDLLLWAESIVGN